MANWDSSEYEKYLISKVGVNLVERLKILSFQRNIKKELKLIY
jgi:hypothetical protein